MLKEQLAKYMHRCHHGAENAAKSKVLESELNISSRELRDLVNALRCDGVPIASDQSGYYYAKTEKEVRMTIRHMKNRIVGINTAISGLKRSLTMFNDTQIRLLLEGGDDL